MVKSTLWDNCKVLLYVFAIKYLMYKHYCC